MILNKSCFKTKIGTLFYLWLDDKRGPKVAALSIGEKPVKQYLQKLKDGSKNSHEILIEDKKYPLLEKNISDFLDGRLEHFDIKPVFLTGTEFEKKVWKETSEIPFGWTCSYGEMAAICGRPGAGRAVGNAMSKNPVLLIVPCHRIIKGDGSLGGFGFRPELKKELLANEGVKI